MAAEKFIRGKKDSCHHEGKRSEIRRLAESRSQLDEYMSHERYPLRERLHAAFSRTIPSEPRRVGFGEVLTDLEITQKFPEVFNHTGILGEALIVPGVNCGEEEAAQLLARGAEFPLRIGEPLRATFVNENGDQVFPRPIKPTDI